MRSPTPRPNLRPPCRLPAARLSASLVSMPLPLALVNARLIDPAAERESFGGVLVVEGKIAGLGAAVTAASMPPDCLIVDCEGDVVSPGLVDMRAFVGEPGAEHRETIASASAAAAAGGVTTLITRPDTPRLAHLRASVGDLGAEHRETIASASAAAAAGGVTTLITRPETNPP